MCQFGINKQINKLLESSGIKERNTATWTTTNISNIKCCKVTLQMWLRVTLLLLYL